MKKKPAKALARSESVTSPDGKPVSPFESLESFERWLTEHHTKHTGVWIQFFKAASGRLTINYAEALDVSLCYGWIDGPVRSVDHISWIHKFTPRGKRSVWSQVNKSHVDRLTREGRMQPAGLAAVEAAKLDGRWDAAYASSSTFVESPEFLAALAASQRANEFYATLSNANRYAFYYRLHTVKKAETKTRKLAEFIAMLERGETFH